MAQATALSPQAVADAAKAPFLAYNEKDWTKAKTTMTPDFTYDEVATARKVTGADQAIEAWKGWAQAFPGSPKCTIHSTHVVSNSLAVLELTWKGNLVLIDLPLALAGEISARAHRQRVGDEARDASDHDRLMLIDCASADHAGDQAEVCGKAIIEAVHNVAKKSAGRCLVPGLTTLASDFAQRRGVIRRLAGEDQRFGATRRSARRLAMHVEVRFDFAPFFFEKHRQQKARPEPTAECRQQSRAPARPESRGWMTVLRQQI